MLFEDLIMRIDGKNRLYPAVILIFVILLLQLSIDGTIIAENNSNQLDSLSGVLSANFGEKGVVSFGFSGYYQSNWNSTTLIELKYKYGLRDQTIFRNVTYFLSYRVEFYDSYEEMICSYEKVLANSTNLGYEFLDSFIQHLSWNLSADITGIPLEMTWVGQLYLYGSLSLSEITYHNTSNRVQVTYSNLPSPFESSGLRIELIILNLSFITKFITIHYRGKKNI